MKSWTRIVAGIFQSYAAGEILDQIHFPHTFLTWVSYAGLSSGFVIVLLSASNNFHDGI